MIIGVPKEIKKNEYRVGLTPASVLELTNQGHTILVEKNAGLEVHFDEASYEKAGAKIINTAAEIFKKSEMIIKVKEPQPSECKMLRENQVLFTFLHLAPDPKQTKGLLESGCIAIAYETVTDKNGRLPLLAPMSEVAGRISVQSGMAALEKHNGGLGILLAGVPGVAPAKVVIIGGGFVGENAAKMALGAGAEVTLLDISLDKLRQLDNLYGPRLKTRYANKDALNTLIKEADLVIGAVLVPGAAAPKLLKKEQLKTMKKGAVLVDVAIDQGGCFETSRPTTHENPTYLVENILHYCVANMPGAVPKTSTLALNNATLPFVIALANKGWKRACKENIHLKNGLNIIKGNITYKAVSETLGYAYKNPDTFLNSKNAL